MRRIHKYFLLAIFVYTFAGASLAQNLEPKTEKTAESVIAVSPDKNPASAAGTSTSNGSTKALVYFYRLKAFVGWALEPLVVCDGKETAKMDNGSYFAVSLEPGKHSCYISNNKSGFEVDLKAGDSRYVKITLEAGAWKGHGVMTLVQSEQAAFEIKNLKLLEASKIRNRDSVTVFEGAKQ